MAAQAVFDVPELFESIFLELEPTQLFLCQRVCKQFRATTAGTLSIRRRLCPDLHQDDVSLPVELSHVLTTMSNRKYNVKDRQTAYMNTGRNYWRGGDYGVAFVPKLLNLGVESVDIRWRQCIKTFHRMRRALEKIALTSMNVGQPAGSSTHTCSDDAMSSAQRLFGIAELRDAVFDKLDVRKQLVLQRVNKAFQERAKSCISLRYGVRRDSDTMDSTTISPVLDSLRGITIVSKDDRHYPGNCNVNSIHLNYNFDKIEKDRRVRKSTEDVKTPTFTFSLAMKTRIDGLTGGDELASDVAQASFKDFYLTTREMKTCLQLSFVDCGGRKVYITIHTLAHLKIGAWFDLVNRFVGNHNDRMIRGGVEDYATSRVPRRESWLDKHPACTWGEIRFNDGYLAWWKRWVLEREESIEKSDVRVFDEMDMTDW
ncbi:hypothetical protein LTR10_014975 [Elasticomyces elasticus]|nr:hypothetical protein LTR10_014975 [Elasticomyces elasticus]KAK4964553.1 hypothetical protein LTR42_012849 [Elasticomyces elasticus]